MSRIINLFVLLMLSVFSSIAEAQSSETVSITGQFSNSKSLENTVICLVRPSDNAVVKTELADESGRFAFTGIPAGTYLIRVLRVDVPVYSGEPFDANENLDLGQLGPIADVQELKEVVVSKAKPFIERQEGKTILNVESSISSTGSSAFEILEKAPGVNIDSNDNITLRGKSGILVQIDGKASPMTGTNLANYLRGLPSGSIEKIEFITNPSSKYDAAGSSIINIKLKKEKRRGTNGSASVSYGQGRYPKTNNNVSLNHRNKKLNLFGNYSFAYREGFTRLVLNRRFYENQVFTGSYDQDNFLKFDFRNHLARLGADFIANDRHTFGVVVNGVSNKFNPTGQNYSDVYDAADMRVSQFQTSNRSHDNWHNVAVNANYKFTIDTTGTVFTADLDYADYGNRTRQNFVTDYLNFDGSPAPPHYRLYGNIHGDLEIYAAKADFTKTLSNKLKVESGVKSSFVKADNDLAFYDRSSGIDIFDLSKSNHFIYKENINAAYVNTSKTFGKWSAQLGLRVENTNITGDQLTTGASFADHYTQLFPTALLSYVMNDHHTLELNYSRRIQRPGYDQLNPFKFYLDPTTYKEGNPYLKPQRTHSVELTHTLNGKIYTTLGFARTTDNITETISPAADNSRVTVQTERNLKSVSIYSLAFIIPVNIAEWWETTGNFNFYFGSYSGNIANTTLSNSGNFTFNLNSVNNFKMGSGFSAELTGNYQAKERYAFDRIDPIWFVNAGLQKKFANSTLKLAVNDIFKSNHIEATTAFTDYREHFDVTRDTRVAVLSYTYNFGSGAVPMRRRTGGADDLKQRVGQGNG